MAKRSLLVVEDEPSVAKQLKWGLGSQYKISVATSAQEARPLLASGNFPVATLDLGLPPYPDSPQEGLQLLQQMPSLSPYTKVIVITGNVEEQNAIRAVALGAADFCPKPIDLQLLGTILSRVYRIFELEEANRQPESQNGRADSLQGMLGRSAVMLKLFERIRQASVTDYSVLITGESGTGKEMVARAIHALGPRREKPFVPINCGAIPENLLESELFGHEKGAFTGAVARKLGRFEQANEGTVFLDEIGELPLAMQVKILRFLQEGTIERLGSIKTLAIDARIIAATNVNLKEAARDGNFREDLYYRLNVVPLEVPALRDRPEDIPLLAQHFLMEECKGLHRGAVVFSAGVCEALAAHAWPGNVRELQNTIRRALSMGKGRLITLADIGLNGAHQEPVASKLASLKETRDQAEIETIQRALSLTGNNISKAAQLLKISRPTLHDLLKKHGLTM